MDVPGRVGHDDVELAENLKVKIPEIAVDPFSMRHALAIYGSLLRSFQLLILLDIVDEFAVRIVTSVEVRTVAEGLVSVLVDDGPEMLFIAVGVSLGLLALVPCAVIAVFEVLLRFEIHCLNFIAETHDVLQLSPASCTLASMSIFSAKREGAFSKFSIICLCSFYFPDNSFRCC